MKNIPILSVIKLKFSLILFLMTLSFSVFAQEVDDELPTAFFGNWVEDISQCDAGSYFSVANSEIGLLVFGLGWSSTEVKVKSMGSYYTLFVNGVSEGGDFESEIKIKMGDDGNLFFIDSDSEEIELVKCDPIESDVVVELEYEIEEIILADEGLEVVELGMEGNEYLETFDSGLPPSFFGNWVEDLSECNGGDGFRIDIADSEGGLLVSGLDWYSTEVKVTSKEGYYTLFIEGVSEEGDFESELNLKMDEDGTLIYSYPESEEIKLVQCNLEGDLGFVDVEYVDVEMVEMELVDTVLAVEEFDMVQILDLETFNIELLQGKWQSIEDEASFMVIEGDRMKNYYGGMDDELDNEMIMISDTCLNESDSENDLPEEKSKYLSNPNLDMCWYIEFVDTSSLTLIYMATGNTLTYRRVE